MDASPRPSAETSSHGRRHDKQIESSFLREYGEKRVMHDQLEFILEGVQPEMSVQARTLSIYELAVQCRSAEVRTVLRSKDMMPNVLAMLCSNCAAASDGDDESPKKGDVGTLRLLCSVSLFLLLSDSNNTEYINSLVIDCLMSLGVTDLQPISDLTPARHSKFSRNPAVKRQELVEKVMRILADGRYGEMAQGEEFKCLLLMECASFFALLSLVYIAEAEPNTKDLLQGWLPKLTATVVSDMRKVKLEQSKDEAHCRTLVGLVLRLQTLELATALHPANCELLTANRVVLSFHPPCCGPHPT